MNNAQKVLGNFLSLFTSEAVTKLFTFAVVIYLARVLEPAGFGELSFAMAIFMYFYMFSTLGLDILGTREIAKDKDNVFEYVCEIGLIKISLSLVSFALLTGFIFIFFPSSQMRWLILFYGLSLFPMALLFEWVFQGIEKMHFIAFSRLISSLAYLLMIFFLVKSYGQLLYVPLLYFVANLLAATFLLLFLFSIYRKISFKIDLLNLKKTLFFALPIGVSFVLAQVYYSFDVVMLGFMRNSVEIGYYNAAFKIYLFLVLFAGIYHSAMFPRISRLYQESPEKLPDIYTRSNRILALVAVPLMFGAILLAGKGMRLLYGEIYSPGILALQILLGGIVLQYINTGYHRGLLACGKERWYFIGVLVPVSVNILLNFIFIPLFGLYGAAVATLLGEVSALIVSYIAFNRIVTAPFLPQLVRPLIASLVMALCLIAGLRLGLGLAWLVLLGGSVYLIALAFVKGILLEDLFSVRAILFSSREGA
ncbi:MAG: flippase [Candidatus Margulisbacteria bacterium]|nr:flippase [Candidatus Margulisiibacteriota bacterium]